MGLILHVLPGDATVNDFKNTGIAGEVIVCRECLIAGPADADTLFEFWEQRARFILAEYGGDEIEYHENVADELAKLLDLPEGTEVNLWFEYELFCQANMWFCLSLLRESDVKVFRVAPVTRAENEIWRGFGLMDGDDMRRCFAERVEFGADDRKLGELLWQAYSNGDLEILDKLGNAKSKCFPYLREVCTAAIEKSFRPKKIIEEITANGVTDFGAVFQEFTERAGVYGFGDTQVKEILSTVNSEM